jgi:chorismate mutase
MNRSKFSILWGESFTTMMIRIRNYRLLIRAAGIITFGIFEHATGGNCEQLWATVSKRGQLWATVGNCKQLRACVGYCGQRHDPLIKKVKRSNFTILWEELLTTMMYMMKEMQTVDQNNKNNAFWVCLGICRQLWGTVGNYGQL